ncbi:MAG: FKBP-type peptidyl-prolyl cis-trans isomerase [Nanoarchaeota archaeon]|nr:FKBP-type peptidyl-prolyl cis-trans isomerase [Nanoarchaeota archaeon]MBU1270546.1 FKBP-type peptidyl-prolyl cis-trans isomerase [Nanoarchaeota archaeon]MBU1605014.1 FKBP-type peptidyl-prolyl cis-trans isomerase [Nanoarchaeota archaeon]MBU2443438.1 FKBP-type peptidyl-prolyl cis-trans isomerase [Nanoarchaeota archaeon]
MESNKETINKETINKETSSKKTKKIEKIKKGDFIELDYTGKIKDENLVFDTTKKSVAQSSGLNPNADYKPAVICLGEGYILPALEDGLVGKEIGTYSFDLSPEQSFGRKSAKLLKLVPLKVFKQQDIVPYTGLEVNIDDMFGIIRSVSGGRIIVDFNHPLASRDISYEIEIKKIVTDDKDKLESIIKIIGIHYDSLSVKDKKAVIVLEHSLPDQLKKLFEEKAKEKTGVETFDYVVKKKQAVKQ